MEEKGFDPFMEIDAQKETSMKLSSKWYLMCLMIPGDENTRYEKLKDELANDHLDGKHFLPKIYDEYMIFL